jgi:hypothetical protein
MHIEREKSSVLHLKVRTMHVSKRIKNKGQIGVGCTYDEKNKHLHLLSLDMIKTKRTTNTKDKEKHQCL